MLDSEIHHTVQLDGTGAADYRSVIAFFARQLLKDLHLVGGYEVLYPKVRDFVRDHLFNSSVNLEDPIVLRNLSEPDVGKIIYDSFKKGINALTIQDSGSFEDGGSTEIEGWLALTDTRPFRTEWRDYVNSNKSVFNKVVGEARAGSFELRFATFLDEAADVQSFAKNYLAVGFKLDYVRADGDLSTYTPDFIVRSSDGVIWIVETKGRREEDVAQKMNRLKQWCQDATFSCSKDGESKKQKFDFLFVDQIGFEKHQPKTFAALASSFTEYKS